MSITTNQLDINQLAIDIKRWGQELGFQQVGITDIDLSQAEQRLQQWLAKKFHGEMEYMQKHENKRSRPADLLPGTIRVISARMDYLYDKSKDDQQNMTQAIVSRYARGRDYHKLIRKRLQKLADKITTQIGRFNYRAFADSAPVLEKPLAEKSGLGWTGKHTNLVNSKAGSWFFLGTLYTDLPLPIDEPASAHCGTCSACIDACPTQAIVAPFQMDARRCISYLTIELKGSIPIEFRPLIGNRIYGCDDCQLVCPWNRFAKISCEKDFQERDALSNQSLIRLFTWTEQEFLTNTEGSAIRRIGHERWLRNIAVALGNAPSTPEIIQALELKREHLSELVREHVAWALKQHFNDT